mmetsp:Transcript_27410/g.87833  ORF Transcript_27410/g.87833 Transcript_27410/m.87833 type:complete len:869 (-) Transcript_27410:75-2681(-)
MDSSIRAPSPRRPRPASASPAAGRTPSIDYIRTAGNRAAPGGSPAGAVTTPRPATARPARKKPAADAAGRVRVVVRLRPPVGKELEDEDDTCVAEMVPEHNRVILRKNQWESDTYTFDSVFPMHSSQRRVYETAARPIVESVMEGYNGTIMAYGQTGTGKTHTMGNLGDLSTKDQVEGMGDASMRGVMIRAIEDIINMVKEDKLHNYSIKVSYLQLYLDTLLDLLVPEHDNISIQEDTATGEVTFPGSAMAEVRTLGDFVKILQRGESNRVVANQKLNSTSSRSHSVLVVQLRKIPKQGNEGGGMNGGLASVTARISKLLVVDLAGSERIKKTGSEGVMLDEAKSINLSLTTLGKCVHSLSEGGAHIPYRDTKLTRMLKDSFGGSARTSMIITIGPRREHLREHMSTLEFGQRALQVENTLKLKEEVDFQLLSRRLQEEVDIISQDNDRCKAAVDKADLRVEDMKAREAQARVHFEEQLAQAKADSRTEREALEWRIKRMGEQAEEAAAKFELERKKHAHELGSRDRAISEAAKTVGPSPEIMSELTEARKTIAALQNQNAELQASKSEMRQKLAVAQEASAQATVPMFEQKPKGGGRGGGDTPPLLDTRGLGDTAALIQRTDSMSSNASDRSSSDAMLFQKRNTISKLFEHVGLPTVFKLLTYDDDDVRLHAVKVVANLAAETAHQMKIVEEGGLSSLLEIMHSCKDEPTRRIAAGAVANLGMNPEVQPMIIREGGLRLLVHLKDTTDDPQTLRMVAGAIANLCGNASAQQRIYQDGGVRALVDLSESMHQEVLSQVARGFANFAKCDKFGAMMLVEAGGVDAVVQFAACDIPAVKRHGELALAQLAVHAETAPHVDDSRRKLGLIL